MHFIDFESQNPNWATRAGRLPDHRLRPDACGKRKFGPVCRAFLLAVLLMVLPARTCDPTVAAEAQGLYRARTIVTGTGEDNQERGIAECLRLVLVKVAGDPRLDDDPAAIALAAKAATLVRAYSYRDRMAGIPVHDEQGTRDRPHFLTVDFDPAKVDAVLRRLKRRSWPEPRPQIAVSLEVRIGEVAYLLTQDGVAGRDQREALFSEASKIGLPVILADGAEEAPVTLTGSLVWDDAALGWVADWILQASGRTRHWTEAGASFDRAFREALGRTAMVLSGNER